MCHQASSFTVARKNVPQGSLSPNTTNASPMRVLLPSTTSASPMRERCALERYHRHSSAGIEKFLTVSRATDILSFVTVSLLISLLGRKCDSLVALAE